MLPGIATIDKCTFEDVSAHHAHVGYTDITDEPQ